MKKIVLKFRVSNGKGPKKALRIATEVDGVSSVALAGKDGDHLVVIGNGVDCLQLTKALRSKLGHAEIVTVHELGADNDAEEAEEMGFQRFEDAPKWNSDYRPPRHNIPYGEPSNPYPAYGAYPAYSAYPAYRAEPDSSCSVM